MEKVNLEGAPCLWMPAGINETVAISFVTSCAHPERPH